MKLNPNDSTLYEQIILQVTQEDKQPTKSFITPLLQTSIGATAGVAVGFFLLPTTSLITCGIIGGLGVYSLANAIQSYRTTQENETATLVIPSSKLAD